jgi:hypothetical protein
MSKKHSSKFFRTYFATADTTDSEAPDRVPRNIPDRPLRRTEAVTASGGTAMADAGHTQQELVDLSPAFGVPEDMVGRDPAFDPGA